ncbi:MAG: sugar phosphate nucleotidyltransferase [Candidatus Methanospirareceae archaeon]
MKALIIAAGKGSRLRELTKTKPKALVQILGLSLIERVILSAKEAGIKEFFIVTGYLGEKIREALRDGASYGVKIEYVENNEWERGNGVSVLKAREGGLDENFILLMTDHIFNPHILKELLKEEIGEDECILCVDRVRGDIDVEEATKVRVEDGYVVDIGKELKDYNAIDCGIFYLSPSIFEALEESIRGGDESLSGGIRVLAERGKVRAFYIGADDFWIDIDTKEDYKRAKRMLCEGLIKPTDGIVSRYINRKISTSLFTPLILRLYKNATPNQVSFLSFAVAAISAFLFLLLHPIIGAILIQIASILDGCDGEIARLKNMRTAIGGFIDAVLDRYADALILLGMFHYSMITLSDKEVLGIYLDPLIIVFISMLSIIGSLMVSYTAARAIADLNYQYRGNRDVRLFLLFIGGMFSYFHPASVLIALLIIAIMTNMVVIWRSGLSWRMFQG